MVIIKLFSCDLQIILLFYLYSSTKSILLTGNITRAVLVKLQCLHHPSFIIQCRHWVNVKIQASLWFKRTCNHLWNSGVTKREKRWMIPIVRRAVCVALANRLFICCRRMFQSWRGVVTLGQLRGRSLVLFVNLKINRVRYDLHDRFMFLELSWSYGSWIYTNAYHY